MADTLTDMPPSIYAGDSLIFGKTVSDYPASAGWTLYYVCVMTGAQLTFNSTADGDVHAINVAAATTADWTAGDYSFQAYVQDGGGVRHTVQVGMFGVKPDISQESTGYDSRSTVKLTLDALEAAFLGRASLTQYEYEVGDRKIKHLTHSQMMSAIGKYRALYRQELEADRLASGQKKNTAHYVRFV